jgi:2'-hydroxyisoflavone reductase
LNRRDFILKTTAASGAVALQRTSIASATQQTGASKRLKILVLGATGHIGPYFVRAALARGHHVSAFVREGKRGAGDGLALLAPAPLPAAVESLYGDRNGDLVSIQARDWDAVIDAVTYWPLWVKSLGEALRGRVRHYTFISSDDVYVLPHDNGTGLIDETSRVLEYTGKSDPYSPALKTFEDPSYQYGPLKVLCEREAEKQFPGRALLVRPSAIVGPHDKLGAFTYLPVRMENGGEMLVVGDPLGPIQMIDIRDMAEWVIRMAEKGDTGVFNCTGPGLKLGWAEMLGAVRGTLSQAVSLTWVPMQWVLDQGAFKNNYNNFLFWPSQGNALGLMSTINAKAVAHGLAFRPLGVTAADTLTWYKSVPAESRKQLLGPVADSLAHEAELLGAWRVKSERGA